MPTQAPDGGHTLYHVLMIVLRKSNNLFIRLYITTVMQYSLIALDIDNTPQDKQILSYFHGKHRQGDLNI